MMSSPQIYTSRFLLPITTPPLEDAALVVRDARIVAVGRRSDVLAQYPAAPRTDFGDAILLPPLINAHTHLELTDYPQWASNAPDTVETSTFVDWILRLIGIKRLQSPETLAVSLRTGLNAVLRSGTGAIADILSQAELLPDYADSPLLGRIDLELIGRGEPVHAALVDRVSRWAQAQFVGDLRRGLSPHAPYTVDPTLLSAIADLSGRRRLPLTIHLAESPAEIQLLSAGKGELVDKLYALVGWPAPEPLGSPVDYLLQAEALRPDTLLIHGVQLDAADIHRIARAGASLVLCPRSNRRLGVGVAPVASLRCQGVNLALGTDSLASNDSLSLYDEMTAALQDYAPVLSPVDIVQIATIGGARALRLDEVTGRLTPGCGAHFQVLHPTQMPAQGELAEFLCCHGRGADVAHLYLHGVDVLEGTLG